MNVRHQTMLDAICHESTMSLFENMGISIEPVIGGDAPAQGDSYAASVGYTAGTARGALSVRASTRLVTLCHPAASDASELSEGAIADWVGELSNQLLGRVKNRLLRHGLEIQLSTPVVVRGRDLCQARLNGSQCVVEQPFHFGEDTLFVCFQIDGEFHLEDESPETESPYVEGDVALF